MATSVGSEGNPASDCCEEHQEGVVAEINITPLTDVFLVLLIIFMVTSTAVIESKAVAQSGVAITPPRSDTAQALERRTDPVLTVTAAGDVYLGRDKVPLAGLEPAIGKALRDGQTDTVLLRGDTSAHLGAAVQVMSIARKAGARNIHVLTSPAER